MVLQEEVVLVQARQEFQQDVPLVPRAQMVLQVEMVHLVLQEIL